MRENATGRPDPLIIRRSEVADLDYATTGVWKIAYADFMTAMMAFFLVMWLVNATSDTTKTGIANYFNPIRLSDATDLSRKGLRDPERAMVDTGTDEAGAAFESAQGGHVTDGKHASPSKNGRAVNPENGLVLRDPYAVLAAISAETVVKAEPDAPIATRMEAAGGLGEPAETSAYLRDPFERLSVASGQSREEVLAKAEGKPDTEGAGRLASHGTAKPAAKNITAGDAILSEAIGPGFSGGIHQSDHATEQEANGRATAPRTKAPAENLLRSARAKDLPEVTIRDSDDGVLISLSDHAQFGMFAIGSADPLPETVEIMEKIAGLLGDLPGRVIISGHTDGRPFRSDRKSTRLNSSHLA